MYEQIHTKAQEIVKCMPGWRYAGDLRSWRAELKNVNEEGLTLNLKQDHKRIVVYGSYPCEWNGYNVKRPRITMSMRRPAADLAKDIGRRFIPKYLPLYLSATEEVAKRYEQVTRCCALADDLADRLGIKVNAYPTYDNYGWMKLYDGALIKLSIPNSHTDTVKFEMHWVPTDLAKNLCSIIGEYWENVREVHHA